MKRILSVVLCLAMILSTMVFGAMSAVSAEEADAPAKVGVDTTTLPTVAVEALTGGEIKATDAGYELTGNVTVSDVAAFADVAAALNEGKTFDGKGYTITLNNISAPLFGETLTAGTIKNFAVAGTYTTTAKRQAALAGLATPAEGTTITVENVVVDFDMTMTVADDLGSAGFFGQANGDGTIEFNNCAFTGTIVAASNSISVRAGGFIMQTGGSLKINLTNCSAGGTITVDCHQGGFIADVNGSSVATHVNCYSNIVLDQTNAKAGEGYTGGFTGWMSGSAVFNASNCVSEASFKINNHKHFTGGFVGDTNGRECNFTDCTSNITSYTWTNDFAQDTFFGGFIGGTRNPSVATTVTFENCETKGDMTITVPNANIGLNWGGFVGRHNVGGSTVLETFEFINCVNNADVTVDSAANATGRNINMAGFVGMLRSANIIANDCVNNGNFTYTQTVLNAGHNAGGLFAISYDAGITIDVDGFVNNGDITSVGYGTGNSYVGGVIGLVRSAPKAFTITNCVNTGAINFSTNENATLDRLEAGGIAGCVNAAPTNISYLTNCINLGDVTVVNNSKEDKANNANDYQMRVGGIAGTVPAKTVIDSCINAGNVSGTAGMTSDSGESAIGPGQPAGGFFGFCGSAVANSVNFGDVTNNSTNAGAVAGYYVATAVDGIKNCVNFGDITDADGAAFVHVSVKAAIDPENAEDTSYVQNGALTNCFNAGTVANILATTEATGKGVYADATGVTAFEAELPAYCTVDVTKSTSAAAYIALIFANVDADLATDYVADAFKGAKEGTLDQTNPLKPDVVFTVAFDVALYDEIEAIVGDENVEVGGIVTLDSYVEKIGSFTHEAFDAFYAANAAALAAKNVEKLYMDADREEKNMVDADAYKTNYVLYIRLLESTLGTTYTARAFVKIGNAYIYSAVEAPVVAE